MKIKKSKLVETLKSKNVSEGIISKLIGKLLARVPQQQLKQTEKEIKDIESKILDTLKDTPEISDEEMASIKARFGIK
jgi:transcriptional regulator NrdR family protein